MRINWIVGGPVICNEEGPAPPVTVVLVTAMENIRVEEESITSLHLNIHQGKHLSRNCFSIAYIETKKLNLASLYLHNLLHSLHISSCLSPNLDVLNPATEMRSLQYLDTVRAILSLSCNDKVSFQYFETSILQVTFVNGYEHSSHVRVETAILVPIAIYYENNANVQEILVSIATAYP